MSFFLSEVVLAWRNVVRQRRRSAIAISAVAFGVTAMLLASGFIEWIFLELRESTINSQLGHVQIVRSGYLDFGKADPYAFLLPEHVPELEMPGDSPLIKVVAPRLSFAGLISRGESTLSFIADGVDPEKQAVFGSGLEILVGHDLSSDDPKGIIIGEGLARSLGIRVGDGVVLLVNTASRGVNAMEVTVRGLFSTVAKSYDDAALRMPITTARQLVRTDGSHIWVVLLNDTAKTDALLMTVWNRLKNDGLEIVPWYELSDFYNKTVTLFATQVHGIRLIIVLTILLSISNTLMVSVMERIGEIGTSRALGVRSSGIIRLFVTEGLLIGCIGGAVGLVLGLLLGSLISAIGIPLPPPPGMERAFLGKIVITGNIACLSLLLGVGATLAASVYPAWRASRMAIVDALRRNR